jgi:hypothetical protein
MKHTLSFSEDAGESSSANTSVSRRSFLGTLGIGAAALGLSTTGVHGQATVQGFEKQAPTDDPSKGWKPVSDRKIRVGIAGNGYCKFGSQFGFQDHPNVEIVAVTDLIPDRCANLANACECKKTYPSLEEMVKDDRIEAIFLATDAPSHKRHCLEVLKHGKHVATAVPAVFGSLEDAHEVYEVVKASGLNYMMFETSFFHEDVHAMRQIYKAGGFGKMVYTEGEYFHFMDTPIPSYKDWRIGLPPQWYPTHSNGYYMCVTEGSFTEVSCMGIPSTIKEFQPENNRYKNAIATEIALFRTSEGGMARMAVSWDTPGFGGEIGRTRGQKGSYNGQYDGLAQLPANLKRPPLPPGVSPGGHGGSHGYLMNEFVLSILEKRKPLVDVRMALNMTVGGIVAHASALKGGELLKIPQFAPL